MHTLDARRAPAAYEAVEPGVLRGFGPQLPLVHHSPAPLGLHAVIAREVLGQEPVRLRVSSEEREASLVADKALPPELAEIGEAWDALPETVKASILAIGKAPNGK